MWRSVLGRSQPLLSRLRRPAGCDAVGTVVLGGSANGITLRRAYACDTNSELDRRRRHLYVVLDERNTGHSIYKLNIDDLDGVDEEAVMGIRSDPLSYQEQPRCLSEPVLRLGFQSDGARLQFEALGSKIVVTCSQGHDDRDQDLTLVYDTPTTKLDIVQSFPHELRSGYIGVATGDKLYTLKHGSHGEAPFYLCRGRDADEYYGYNSEDERKANEWGWRRSFWPLPIDRRVNNNFVRSYAVYPDGHTIFVSSTFTFSIDTYSGGEPTRRGDWCLPFHGRAYYDGDLDAWVGIQAAGGPGVGIRGYHYLCSCDVPSPLLDSGGTGGGTMPPPAWKMCKQDLGFLEGPVHDISHALVHTGRSRFCLVETMPMWAPIINDAEHVLHVTMFRAKHGKNGELVVTPCRPSRSYHLPNSVEGSPTAFWM